MSACGARWQSPLRSLLDRSRVTRWQDNGSVLRCETELTLMPTYSVVVATIGGRASLRDCIEAVLRQTVTAKEVIVVGAAPTRRPSWLPSSVRYETTRPSTSAQRNVGVRFAKGDLVLFVD